MLLFPLALALGLLTGIAAGGRFAPLSRLRFKAPAIVIGALVLQAALALPVAAGIGSGWRLVALAVSYAAAGTWLVLNLPGRTNVLATGLAVTGLGWLLNMTVVLANGGMPVSTSALGRLGLDAATLAGGGPLGKHVQLTVGSRLGGLGDTIAIPMFRSIVSVGDLVMIVGLVVAIAAAMAHVTDLSPVRSRALS